MKKSELSKEQQRILQVATFYYFRHVLMIWFAAKYSIVTLFFLIDSFDIFFSGVSILVLIYFFIKFDNVKTGMKGAIKFMIAGYRNGDGNTFPRYFVDFLYPFFIIGSGSIVMFFINFIAAGFGINALNFTDWIDFGISIFWLTSLIIVYFPRKV